MTSVDLTDEVADVTSWAEVIGGRASGEVCEWVGENHGLTHVTWKWVGGWQTSGV